MARVGSAKMSPMDDELARLLVESMGFSFKRVATLMETTDKTVKAGVERAKCKGESPFPVSQKKKLEAMLDFYRWLDEGRERGYLRPLISMLDRDGIN